MEVNNDMAYTTVDNNVTTTVAIGLVENTTKDNGVYLLKTITTEKSPETYDDMVRCTAATIDALRGQYKKIQSDAEAVSANEWNTWCELARCLTFTSGERNILYKINPINGLPSFVYCEIPNQAEHRVQPRGNPSVCAQLYKNIKDKKWLVKPTSPYQAFSEYGNILQTNVKQKIISGIDTPVVANQHMKITDSPELQWINVAMHFVHDSTPVTYTGLQNENTNYQQIMNRLKRKPEGWSNQFATQIMAPYPVQWSTSDAARSQAMEIAAMKLVGHENYKRYLGAPGSAMNVTMGAAYFVIKPQLHQMHLKAMYTQDDKVMPLASGNAAFVRDITPTGVRNRYLQALMLLGVG